MNELIYLKNVATLELTPEKCVGCGICLVVCPHEVFQLNHKSVEIRYRDRCMECGACQKNCPTGALTVQAGVGCAQAVINSALGRTSDCCCTVDPEPKNGSPATAAKSNVTKNCC